MATADFGSRDPETVALLRQILEDAWKRLTLEQRARTPKSEIALRILQLAQRGECDPIRLRAGALAGLVRDTQDATVEDREFGEKHGVRSGQVGRDAFMADTSAGRWKT